MCNDERSERHLTVTVVQLKGHYFVKFDHTRGRRKHSSMDGLESTEFEGLEPIHGRFFCGDSSKLCFSNNP